MQFLLAFFNALPTAPAGSPADMAQDGIAFFTTWIQRVGGIVSFVGAIKLALSLKNDEGREQMTAVLTMISGFMITAAVTGLNVFQIPATYTETAATTEFQAILRFIGRWIRRAGAAGIMLGAIMTALSMKDNNPAPKVNGVKYMAVGGMVWAISTIIDTFV